MQRITMLATERKNLLNKWSSLDLNFNEMSRLIEICRTGPKATNAKSPIIE